MPPRRKSSSRPMSRSPSQNSPSASRRPSGLVTKKSPSLPAPDPAAVQRLIDEALAHARERRASQDTTAPIMKAGASAHQPVPTRRARPFFPASASEKIRDMLGAFLVTCITVYFTWAGYAFYHELSSKQ
ncbi:hypothetical protein JKF63_04751 [Porcisia hertigi]|uniref:Uncharacterized protein n=1 Tax=Porcisia hertigi TaxID=2761500 RepID=A0A836ITS3_9TRYP|nr:hypothetical protein JKF63_04751 [Porcisia hertigi]